MFKYLGDGRSVYVFGFYYDNISLFFREVQKMRLKSGKLSLHSSSSLHSCLWHFWSTENSLSAIGEDIE